jgi:hypothetical protein
MDMQQIAISRSTLRTPVWLFTVAVVAVIVGASGFTAGITLHGDARTVFVRDVPALQVIETSGAAVREAGPYAEMTLPIFPSALETSGVKFPRPTPDPSSAAVREAGPYAGDR